MLSRHSSALLLGLLASCPVWSAENLVAPGTGTLAAAIAAATAGDTLVLENGTYAGDVLIDKALTLRGVNSQVIAMVTGASFVVDASDAEVTLQGLDLAMTLDVNAAAEMKILENIFYNGADIDLADYKTSEGDGGLMVIGNHLLAGGDIQNIATQDAYRHLI